MTFPDIGLTGAYLLAEHVLGENPANGLRRAGTETPADLQQRLDFIRVGRVTGEDDGITDYPVFEVDYFSATRDGAVAGSEAVRDFLTLNPYHYAVVEGRSVLLEGVRTRVGPRQLPWLGTGVWRFTGVYAAQTRRS